MEEQQQPAFAGAALEAALDCVIVVDHVGRVLSFNRAAEETFGFRREEAIGRELAELIVPPEHRERHRSALARCAAGEAPTILDQRLELTGVRDDGTRFPVELTVTRVPGTEPPVFAGYLRDISDRHRSTAAVRAALDREREARAEAELQRHGTRRVMAQALQAEERERHRLALGLHDGPMQELLAAQMELRRVHATDGGADALERGTAAIARAIAQLRDTVFDLYPPSLEESGLGAALTEVAESLTRRSPARIEVDVAEPPGDEHARLLFSLCRELLSNAVRHAGASHIAVRVRDAGDEVEAEIEDDGTGMAAERADEALRDGHIGLATCTERVEALRGRLAIEAGPSGGVLVRISLPTKRPAGTSS